MTPYHPLLFVLGMEYLSRLLTVVGESELFKFHPRCKGLKLNHLCFADDLMLFCKGDVTSAQILCDCLDILAASSGLHANASNSALYLARTPDTIQLQIAQNLRLPLGKLPFKYSGVPLTSKSISTADCDALVDKMTAKIRSWSSKFLSYAARVQLVTVVLKSICTYWSQLFILPRAVIKKMDAICRNYLWHADPSNTAPGNVNWNDVCTPKKLRRLGIRNLARWNEAAVGKLAWHVTHLQESLWVRWVHGVYTKGANWSIFNPPVTASWSLKKICRVKDKLQPWILKDKYKINEVYQDFFTTIPKVPWSRFVWNRASTPKRKFILWLLVLNKLRTKNKLLKIQLIDDDQCSMCLHTAETIEHLFFQCPFSTHCLKELGKWLQLYTIPQKIADMINFKWKVSCFQQKVIIASICSLGYYIWKTRMKQFGFFARAQ